MAGDRLTRRDRLEGRLLGGAVGDALGAPAEFLSLSEIRDRFGPEGIRSYAPAYGRLGAITDDTQMTLFAAEGLIRARQRYRDRGICNPTMVVWHAYLRWLGTQGIERFDPEFPAQHGGWLYEQPELHSRRAPGNTCLSAVASGECGTIAAAPISRTLKIISTCEMGTPKPFSTAAASRKDSPSPHSTTDITLGRSECLQPGCKPGGVTVTLAPQLSHWY